MIYAATNNGLSICLNNCPNNLFMISNPACEKKLKNIKTILALFKIEYFNSISSSHFLAFTNLRLINTFHEAKSRTNEKF